MKRRAHWLVFALLGFTASGCALFGSEEHVYGTSSLSDAAAHAAPHAAPDTAKVRRSEVEERARPLDVGYTVPPTEEITAGTATSLGATTTGAPSEGGSEGGGGSFFGLTGGAGSLGGTTLDGYGVGGLVLGGYLSSRWRLDLAGSFGGVNFSGQSVAGSVFQNEFELNVDLSTRYYLTAQHTFMGLYPLVGLRVGTLFWDFARPVDVIEDGETKSIVSDRVNFFSAYAGAGAGLMQIRHVDIGVNVAAGIKLYDVQTHEGFSNDLFPDAGFVQIMFEAMYKF